MHTSSNPKRQAILSAARRVFLAYGYGGASMEAIALAAPVSKPTLYSHFKGKQDLFAAVVAGQCEGLLGTLARARTGQPDPEAGLKSIVRAFADLIYAQEALGIYRLAIAEWQLPGLGELVYRCGPEPALGMLSSYLAELDARGAVRVPDVERSSRLLLGMLKGEEHLRCLLGLRPGPGEAEKDRIVDAAVALFLRGHGYEV